MIKTTKKLTPWLAVAVFLLGMGRLMKTKSILVLAIVALLLVTAWPCEPAFADSIVGWGRDDYGQATPPAGNDYVAIAAGGSHSLALKSDGSIVGWGSDTYGKATPPGGYDYVAIAAASSNSLALKSDGSIVAWGNTPTPPAGNDYVAIAAGHGYPLALKSDGTIVGWSGDTPPPAGSDFVAITRGWGISFALKSDGSIVGWGTDIGHVTPPQGNDFVAIAASSSWYALALKSDGSIFGWGEDDPGAPPLYDYVAIAAGRWHALALKSDGSIVGWGDDREGQATPPAGNDYVAISAGGHTGLALVADPNIPRTFHVDVVSGDDNNNGFSKGRAFATIQKGIDTAVNGSTILVWPGVYVERINFQRKAITVASADYPAVIEAPWQDAVSFHLGEGPDSILKNFVIRESATAVICNNESSPTLKNLTIVDNDFGIAAYEGSEPNISNCILWNNRDGDLFGDGTAYSWVEQNVSIDPLFADSDSGDYHLLSQKGRYVPAHGLWSFDNRTSPCIDGGDPADDPMSERMPNGGRINIGACGGTPYASMSEWPIRHDSGRNGRVDFEDFAAFCDEWLLELEWAAPAPPLPDETPPRPDPATWSVEPYAVSPTLIHMEAGEAWDDSGVEYNFENITGRLGHSSGWQTSPYWSDMELSPGTEYCYRVKTRDISPNANEGGWSSTACATTE